MYGNLAVFRRAENSFHGHLPYEGERRVIQVAWLTSQDEKMRKTQRGKLSRLFKKLFGGIDRRLGAGRDKNAAHKELNDRGFRKSGHAGLVPRWGQTKGKQHDPAFVKTANWLKPKCIAATSAVAQGTPADAIIAHLAPATTSR